VNITETLLGPLLSSSPARPLLTHYDDAAQTRIELSGATLANWAAKTANWLVEEFDVEVGDPVCVRLPTHWQTAGVLLGAFWAGAHVVTDPQDARVVFVPPGEHDFAAPQAVVALDPLGRGVPGGVAAPALDYLAESRVCGDVFTPMESVPDDSPALEDLTAERVLAAARKHADDTGLHPQSRLLSTIDWTLPDGLLRGLLAPLAAGASVVQITDANPEKLDSRRETERTTVDLLG